MRLEKNIFIKYRDQLLKLDDIQRIEGLDDWDLLKDEYRNVYFYVKTATGLFPYNLTFTKTTYLEWQELKEKFKEMTI